MWKQVLIGCGGAVALATAALADSSAVTTGNLNLRSGPGKEGEGHRAKARRRD